MISQNSFSAAGSIESKLTANRKVARPLQGTPLEQLVMVKDPLEDVNVQSEGGEVTDRCMCDTEEHKATMETVINAASNGVNNLLYLAKNSAVPQIQDLVDKYQKYLESAVNITANNYEIKPAFDHEIWENSVVLSLAEKYTESVPLVQVPLTLRFPSKNREELVQLIATGSQSFDSEVQDFIAKATAYYGFDVLEDVYNTIFSFDNSKSISKLDDYINPFSGNRFTGLLVLLLANRLMVNIPDGMDIDLSGYQAYVSSLIEQSGRVVSRVITMIDTDVKNKSLIVSYPSVPFGNQYVEAVIEVNGRVYKKWLAEGGQPEILLGAYATDTNRNYDVLLERKDDYLKAWDREKRLIDAKVRFEMKGFKSTALRKAFYDVISNLPEDVQRQPNSVLVEITNVIVDDLTEESFNSIYVIARCLICAALYSDTDVEELLISIDRVGEANPGIDPREAALLATVEYVSGWVGSQIQLVNY